MCGSVPPLTHRASWLNSWAQRRLYMLTYRYLSCFCQWLRLWTAATTGSILHSSGNILPLIDWLCRWGKTYQKRGYQRAYCLFPRWYTSITWLIDWLWGETCQNRGHQRACCSSSRWYVSTESNSGMISTGETPDSSTRALWKFYQQSHLVAKRKEHGEGRREC
jgi:hypothetical protein